MADSVMNRFSYNNEMATAMDIVPWLLVRSGDSRIFELAKSRQDLEFMKVSSGTSPHGPVDSYVIMTKEYPDGLRSTLEAQDFADGHFIGRDRQMPVGAIYSRRDAVIIVDESVAMDGRYESILQDAQDAGIMLMYLDNVQAHLNVLPDIHVATRVGLLDNFLELSPNVVSYLCATRKEDDVYLAAKGEYYPIKLYECPNTYFMEPAEFSSKDMKKFLEKPGISGFDRNFEGSSIGAALSLALILGYQHIFVADETGEMSIGAFKALAEEAHMHGVHITPLSFNKEMSPGGLYPTDMATWIAHRFEQLVARARIQKAYLKETATQSMLDVQKLYDGWEDLIKEVPALDTVLTSDARKEYEEKLKTGSCTKCVANATLAPLLNAFNLYLRENMHTMMAVWKKLFPDTTYYILGGRKIQRIDNGHDTAV